MAAFPAPHNTVVCKQEPLDTDLSRALALLIEARVLQLIQHDHVLILRGLLLHGSQLTLLTEYCPNGNLRDYLRDCRPGANAKPKAVITHRYV